MNSQIREPDFQARIGKITASNFHHVTGKGPYANREGLMREMVRAFHGAEREFQGNQYTRWGQLNEQKALDALSIEMGVFMEEGQFTLHPKYDFISSTPDSVIPEKAVAETKCPGGYIIGGPDRLEDLEYAMNPANWRPITKSISDMEHYYQQCQVQMACMMVDECYFVQWTPREVKIEIVKRDKMFVLMWLPEVQAFLDEYHTIIASEELSKPYLEPLVVEHDEPEWQSKAAELSHINAQMKNLTAREKELKQQLIELADGKKSTGCGVTVYPTTRKSVDYKRLLDEKHIDTTGFEKESISWTVRVQ